MMCIWNTGTLKIIQVHSKSYRYTQNYTDTLKIIQVLKIIQIHSKLYRYTQNHTGTLKIIQVHSKSYRYTQNYTGTLKIIQVHSKPKDWKAKQSEVFGNKKTKGPKQDLNRT